MSHSLAQGLASLRPHLRSAGVTGTNGKTTTTSMIAAIVAAAGELSARTTTLGSWVGDRCVSRDVSLAAFERTVREAVHVGVRTIAVETTSKALGRGFARAWPADVAVFTNLTRDHLDVHGTPEAYLAAKAQLFMTLPPDGAVVWNLEDPCSALLDELVPARVRRLGWVVGDVHPDCAHLPLDLRATGLCAALTGTRFDVAASPGCGVSGGPWELACVGAVHVRNALAAALAAAALGYGDRAIREGLRAFRGLPGRFELVSHEPKVVIDYAHTPDALARTLSAARDLARDTQGRVTCVFGCGGDKDRSKRGPMGRVADEHADAVFITNDNPRSEDPDAILDDIESGVPNAERRASWCRLADRRGAIHRALLDASDADVVVVAGRGHEDQQLLADGPVPFSDRDVAVEALASRRRARDTA